MAIGYPTLQNIGDPKVTVTFHYLTSDRIVTQIHEDVSEYVVTDNGRHYLKKHDGTYAVVEPGWIAKTQTPGAWVL